MPGCAPGCKGLTSGREILNLFPNLKYEPRPEPDPQLFKASWDLWYKEYKEWRDLRCHKGRGYFCRQHGSWITCDEIEADLARDQDRENEDPEGCPRRHYDLVKIIEDFHRERDEELHDLSVEARSYSSPGATSTANDPVIDASGYGTPMYQAPSNQGFDGTTGTHWVNSPRSSQAGDDLHMFPLDYVDEGQSPEQSSHKKMPGEDSRSRHKIKKSEKGPAKSSESRKRSSKGGTSSYELQHESYSSADYTLPTTVLVQDASFGFPGEPQYQQQSLPDETYYTDTGDQGVYDQSGGYRKPSYDFTERSEGHDDRRQHKGKGKDTSQQKRPKK